jgi:hypothetical protein
VRLSSLLIPAAAVLFTLRALSFAQSVPPGAPLPHADVPPTIRLPRSTTASSGPMQAHNDPKQFRDEARQLLDLAQSLQADVEQINRGLIDKSFVDKLKRIEKLSKSLRNQVYK